jgi:hypothetical protein
MRKKNSSENNKLMNEGLQNGQNTNEPNKTEMPHCINNIASGIKDFPKSEKGNKSSHLFNGSQRV